MNRIVREHYPVERLPEDLREGIPAGEQVTVTVEPEREAARKDAASPGNLTSSEHVMSLEEIFAARRPPFRSAEEISKTIRRDRDSWDE
jgi:hypothetical protein